MCTSMLTGPRIRGLRCLYVLVLLTIPPLTLFRVRSLVIESHFLQFFSSNKHHDISVTVPEDTSLLFNDIDISTSDNPHDVSTTFLFRYSGDQLALAANHSQHILAVNKHMAICRGRPHHRTLHNSRSSTRPLRRSSNDINNRRGRNRRRRPRTQLHRRLHPRNARHWPTMSLGGLVPSHAILHPATRAASTMRRSNRHQLGGHVAAQIRRQQQFLDVDTWRSL